MKPLLLRPAAKAVLFAACLLPFAWLCYGAWAGQLGPNPAEALIRGTGDWAGCACCARPWPSPPCGN